MPSMWPVLAGVSSMIASSLAQDDDHFSRYAAQVLAIPDVSGDSCPDIVVWKGRSNDKIRPMLHLELLSGSDSSVLGQCDLPLPRDVEATPLMLTRYPAVEGRKAHSFAVFAQQGTRLKVFGADWAAAEIAELGSVELPAGLRSFHVLEGATPGTYFLVDGLAPHRVHFVTVGNESAPGSKPVVVPAPVGVGGKGHSLESTAAIELTDGRSALACLTSDRRVAVFVPEGLDGPASWPLPLGGDVLPVSLFSVYCTDSSGLAVLDDGVLGVIGRSSDARHEHLTMMVLSALDGRVVDSVMLEAIEFESSFPHGESSVAVRRIEGDSAGSAGATLGRYHYLYGTPQLRLAWHPALGGAWQELGVLGELIDHAPFAFDESVRLCVGLSTLPGRANGEPRVLLLDTAGRGNVRAVRTVTQARND